MHSPAEAKAFAAELHRLMTYAGVTKGDLYHGNMRFDVNISIAKKGATKLGTRAEVKNLNSFRSVERAAEFEFHRQVERIEKGENIIQETRGWDETTGKTGSQRSKEDAQDYRYMPDPDIPPIALGSEDISDMQKDVPPLPSSYRDAWSTLHLDRSVVDALLAKQSYAVLISEVQQSAGDEAARRVAHWFSSAVGQDAEQVSVKVTNYAPTDYAQLAEMVTKNELSSTAAKEVFSQLLVGSGSPRDIAKAKNLLQESDEAAIQEIVDAVLVDPASQQSVIDIKAGQDKAIGFLVGQVMKRSAGKANPALAQKLIRQKLEE